MGQPIEAHTTAEVHARVVVHAVLAQRLVLDEVEIRRLSEEREELVLPGIAEDAAEIPDRLDVRVAREDLLDGERVVRVDQERLLLRLRPGVELGARHLLVVVEDCLELRAVLHDAGVVDARRVAVLHVAHVLLQQLIPRLVRVVEGEGAGGGEMRAGRA
jgi:hypothetical protein